MVDNQMLQKMKNMIQREHDKLSNQEKAQASNLMKTNIVIQHNLDQADGFKSKIDISEQKYQQCKDEMEKKFADLTARQDKVKDAINANVHKP